MSFDMMVFDPEVVPYRDRKELLRWWEVQSQWAEDRDWDSTEGTSAGLVAFFDDIRQTFVPMNGPYAPSDEEIEADENVEDRLTDYTIGGSLIYVAFPWSLAEEAYEVMRGLAAKHGIGFWNVSGSIDEVEVAGEQV